MSHEFLKTILMAETTIDLLKFYEKKSIKCSPVSKSAINSGHASLNAPTPPSERGCAVPL